MVHEIAQIDFCGVYCLVVMSSNIEKIASMLLLIIPIHFLKRIEMGEALPHTDEGNPFKKLSSSSGHIDFLKRSTQLAKP